MHNLSAFSPVTLPIRYVLTDIDDTLTTHGKLTAEAYTALEKLKQANYRVIPITGRPAGWCDHMARMWPIDAIVGENGAFYFYYDSGLRKLYRRYWVDAKQREQHRRRLNQIQTQILQTVPNCRVSADQAYREADLAIDFCEDIEPLTAAEINQIVAIFENAGAKAKISSIHVNGWFGDYNKLTMTQLLFTERFHQNLDQIQSRQVVFCGDSPNDEPMFAYFSNSIGVANIRRFTPFMTYLPQYITPRPGGGGFAEIADCLLHRRPDIGTTPVNRSP